MNYDISSKLFFDWQFDANIVAVDFLMGSSVVEAAVVANQKRAKSKESAKELLPTKIFLDADKPIASHLKKDEKDYNYYYYDDNSTDTLASL